MPKRRKRRNELSDAEFFELWIGKAGRSAFETPFLKRAAWKEHREELMAACAPGLRPAAWWEFEAPEYGDPPKHCNPAAEIAFLRKHGLLSPEEEAQLKVMEELRKGSGT